MLRITMDRSNAYGGLPGDLDNVTTDYLYSGVQCVEERDGSDAVQRQYVWGLYVDELIQQESCSLTKVFS
jgi:hypothetical protein